VNATREVTDIQQLGLQIDLKPEQLEVIKNKHPYNHDNAKCDVFDFWLKNDLDASWTKLQEALHQIPGHFVLSQKIHRDYVGEEIQLRDCFC
jgi:hypothetical protein